LKKHRNRSAKAWRLDPAAPSERKVTSPMITRTRDDHYEAVVPRWGRSACAGTKQRKALWGVRAQGSSISFVHHRAMQYAGRTNTWLARSVLPGAYQTSDISNGSWRAQNWHEWWRVKLYPRLQESFWWNQEWRRFVYRMLSPAWDDLAAGI